MEYRPPSKLTTEEIYLVRDLFDFAILLPWETDGCCPWIHCLFRYPVLRCDPTLIGLTGVTTCLRKGAHPLPTHCLLPCLVLVSIPISLPGLAARWPRLMSVGGLSGVEVAAESLLMKMTSLAPLLKGRTG